MGDQYKDHSIILVLPDSSLKLESPNSSIEINSQNQQALSAVCEKLPKDELIADAPQRVEPVCKDLDILEDFIRFDLAKRGDFCCAPSYTVSVQYEDRFLIGESDRDECCSTCCFLSPTVNLILKERSERVVQIKLDPTTTNSSCFLSKNCRIYLIRCGDGYRNVGRIRLPLEEGIQEIINISEKCSFRTKKVRLDVYSIYNELGGTVAVVEITRGFRGGILSYGLTVIDDAVSATSKALFISATIVMDLEDRESEMKCKLLWAPLVCIILLTVVIIIHFLPSVSN